MLHGNFWRSLAQDESGSTAMEYALMAALISVAILASVISLRDNLIDSFYNKIATNVK